MSSPTLSTPQSPAETAEPVANSAGLERVRTALLAAQAELDRLGHAVAAARLDAVLDAVNVAILTLDTDQLP